MKITSVTNLEQINGRPLLDVCFGYGERPYRRTERELVRGRTIECAICENMYVGMGEQWRAAFVGVTNANVT